MIYFIRILLDDGYGWCCCGYQGRKYTSFLDDNNLNFFLMKQMYSVYILLPIFFVNFMVGLIFVRFANVFLSFFCDRSHAERDARRTELEAFVSADAHGVAVCHRRKPRKHSPNFRNQGRVSC